jgi:hypothetical protein
MSGFYNPYSPKPQLLSGLMGLGTDALSIMSLLKFLKGDQGGSQSMPTSTGGGASGTMGGMAGQNILRQAPQDMAPGPTYNPPPQANQIPQGATLGQTNSAGQGGMDPKILALLSSLMGQ